MTYGEKIAASIQYSIQKEKEFGDNIDASFFDKDASKRAIEALNEVKKSQQERLKIYKKMSENKKKNTDEYP